MKDELEDGTPNPNVRIDCNGNRHCRACENRRNTRKTMNNIIKRHIAEQ